jgi:hypothetical protein
MIGQIISLQHRRKVRPGQQGIIYEAEDRSGAKRV